MIKASEIKNLPRSIIAAAFKMTGPNVNQWKKRGCPQNKDGTFDLAAVIEWRLDELSMTSGAPEDPAAKKWLTKFRKERALKARTERKAIEGKLLDANEVKRIGFQSGLQIKQSCLAIPDRCAPLVAASSDTFECKQILVEEITNILENLADALLVIE